MIAIQYRPCGSNPAPDPDHSTPWTLVTEVMTHADADDYLASWVGPALSHGDLVRVVGESRKRLHVVDEHSLLRAVPLRIEEWEGADANALTMLQHGEAVDCRRCVLAACDLARSVMHLVPETARDEARALIDDAERDSRADAVNRHRLPLSSLSSSMRSCAAGMAAWWVEARPDFTAEEAALAQPDARAEHAAIVRKHIPLSVVACAIVGATDPCSVEVTP